MIEYIFRHCSRCTYSTPTLTDRCSVCDGYLPGVTVIKKVKNILSDKEKNLLSDYDRLSKNKI